jgi:hypothetical protein
MGDLKVSGKIDNFKIKIRRSNEEFHKKGLKF